MDCLGREFDLMAEIYKTRLDFLYYFKDGNYPRFIAEYMQYSREKVQYIIMGNGLMPYALFSLDSLVRKI